MKSMQPRLLTFLLVGFLGLIAAGCGSYTSQTKGMNASWQGGDLATAVTEANKMSAEKAGGRDELVWYLEQGTVLRAAGLYEQSVDAFEEAEVIVQEQELAAKTQVSEEVGAAFSNLAVQTYRGRAYDRIMMNTYKALNFMALGDMESARVELNRALQRQRDAVAENAKRIEEAEEAARIAAEGGAIDEKGGRQTYDVERAKRDPKLAAQLAQIESEMNTIEVYADYVNPFTVFLHGLYFMTTDVGASDWEAGRKSIERVVGMARGNRYIAEDFALAESRANGAAIPPVTYVIFETGRGPYRKEFRIDLPLFLINNEVDYAGAAVPRLRFNEDYIPGMTITAGATTFTTDTLSSMDSVVQQDFNNEWPTVLTKTLIGTATKALVAWGLKEATEDQGMWVALAGRVAGVAYQASTNQADLRQWITLPKEFQYARLETPQDRLLTLQAGIHSEVVSLQPGTVNVVYVRSITPQAPLVVSQFVLK